MTDDKDNLEQLSIKLEQYSPNDYFDYMPDENAERADSTTAENENENQAADHINNNASAANGPADSAGLLALLTEWGLDCLYRSCVDQLMDVEMLRYITPAQCNLLAADFPLGIKIKFVAKVMQWRGY